MKQAFLKKFASLQTLGTKVSGALSKFRKWTNLPRFSSVEGIVILVIVLSTIAGLDMCHKKPTPRRDIRIQQPF